MRFFFSFFSIHGYAVLCVWCVNMLAYVHAHPCESQRKMLDVLVLFSLSFFETESLHEPNTRAAVSTPW